MAHDVFISYASKDQVAAEQVCQRLESNGIPAWIAPRDMLAGQQWGGAIVAGIR